MPLEKTEIPLTFSEGIDTKEDPKAVAPMKLLLCENARRKKGQKIEKRYGCQKLGDAILNSTSVLSDAEGLGVFDKELIAFSQQSVFSYSEQADRWIDKGPAISVKAKLTDVLKNNYEQSQIDTAVNGDLVLTAWEDSRGGVRLSLFDYITGTQLLSDYSISATATRPRCLAYGSDLYLLFLEVGANELKGYKITPNAPLPFPTVVTISSAVNGAAPNYDAFVQDTYIVVAYNVQGAAQVRLHKLNENLAVQTTVNIAEAGTDCVAVLRGPGSRIFVAWHVGGNVRCAVYNVNVVQTVAPFTVEAAANIVRITGYSLPDETGVRFFYEQTAAATYNYLIRQNTVTNAGAAGTASVFLRSVGLASKAFAYSPDTTDRGFVAVVHSSTLQSTFFLARNDGLIVGKLAPGKAGGLMSRTMLPEAPARAEGKYLFGALTKNPVVAENNNEFLTFRGASIAEIDFTDLSNFTGETLGQNYHIVGGVVQMFDGISVVEHGFHLFPENVTLAESAGGSLTATGVYNYKVVFEWYDRFGQIHRSAPSPAVQFTLTGVNNRITVTVPTLRLTQKHTNRAGVIIHVYRTENAGTIYYRASSASAPTFNDPTANTVAIVDNLADSSLIGNELLYTEGGIIDNIAPPAASIICTYKNRVVLWGTEDDVISISKFRQDGFPVEFSDEINLRLDRFGGEGRAAATMDDKLILFKEEAIYMTFGDGPDNTGLNGEFAPPERIASDVGCIDANALAVTPLGIVFKSRKGRYLLSRDLQLTYIGAEVEYWNDLTDTAAVVVPELNEVRFTTLEAPTLSYNYFFKQWFVHGFAAADAVQWKNNFAYIRTFSNDHSKVVKEVPGFFLDIDQKYSLKIGTAWFSIAGLQGIERIYRAIFLGEYKSQHNLRISVRYDFSPAFTEDHLWDAASSLGLTNYGDGAYYGSDAVYGGASSVFQPRVHLGNQKCQAAQFQIEDLTQDSGSYESFNLTGMALQVGKKKGLWKTRAEASM